MEVAELSKLSSVVSDFDGASELTDGVVDGEEPKDRDVGPDSLSYPCVPVSAPSPSRVAGAEDRGYGALVNVVDTIGDVSSPSFSCLGPKTRSCPDFQNAGVAETVGAGECPATLSPMVCSSLSSRSLGPQFLDCADEQRNGLVGSLVEDCWRALETVNPRLILSYDSRQHRDSRVRVAVQRKMEEVEGSIRDGHRPDLGSSLP
ncbi:hypothetical protein Dimus_030470 [Dionaea muscipula]